MADTSVSNESLALKVQTAYKGPKLRVALIGCGGISGAHMSALREIPEVEVVAGVDIDSARLKVMDEKWGVKALYRDWKKMLKEIKPDVVDVLTPNGLHAPASIDSAKAGCHVLTEKPMAMNPGECQKMIDAADKAGKKLCIGFQYRYHPNTQFIKRAADSGYFGKIMFAKVHAMRRRGIPNWGVFGQKHIQGGGPMIDIGVHAIEMTHYAMGRPKPVAAQGNTWTYCGNKPSNVLCLWSGWDHKTYTVEDLAVGQVRFDNGAIMQLEASFVAHIKEDVWNFELMGEKGGCSWNPAELYGNYADTMLTSTPAFLGSKNDFGNLFLFKLRNFVDSILKNTPMEAPGEDGLAVQKIIDGVYRSAEAKKEVAIT